MFKRTFLAAAALAAVSGAASAAPISGSFSLTSFGGTYMNTAGNATAANATGLDFGDAFKSMGNGYGTNGSALVGNSLGSFVGLDGTTASVADIALTSVANPFQTNPFISFGANSPITLNFTDAAFTRSPLGTSVTITGAATFSDGIPADQSAGIFSLSSSSRNGSAAAIQFTFTSNASTTDVPEPMSLAMVGTGLAAVGFLRRKRRAV